MGWINEAERKRLRTNLDCVCNGCGKIITGMVFVDPKGGYLPKPTGTPDFLPKKPKVTYDEACNDLRLGRKPKERPVRSVVETKTVEPVKVTVAGPRATRKLAQKILEFLALNKKKKLKVSDIRDVFQGSQPAKILREALNYLWAGSYITREGGGLRAVKGKAIPTP